MDDDLYDADYRALAALRYHIRLFQHFSERAARSAGLQPQQHQLLLALRGAPEGVAPTVGYLAERLQLQHHSVVGLIDRLEARGLIVRERGKEDRRTVRVRLTRRGEAVLQELTRYHQAEIRSVGPALIEALRAVIQTSQRDSSGTGPYPVRPDDHAAHGALKEDEDSQS